MAKPFYVTTPIYYPSDKLHIGHALTTTMADTMARYKRMRGYDVFFLTGSDEHGQKIEKTAREAGMEPIEYTDRIVASFQELWKTLHIDYSDFIRTTEKRHYDTVAKLFQRIYEKGDIYKSEYEGYYCTPCESFFTERQLHEKACPDCQRPVELIREESYFFRMSKYQDRLIEYIEAHPEFIEPATRRNEMLSFLRQGLEDLCVSRTTFDWGVPVPIDPGHVIYVWFDALTNYLTAVDYLEEGELYRKYWEENPEILHLLAKDILRFHTVIWPIILMAADIKIPRQVFAHGWLLMDGAKMSKSKGNVIDPMQLAHKYGADAIRYFLLREMPFGDDGYYTEEALVLRTNTDLANDYGNLLSRTTSMINKFAGGVIPSPAAPDEGAEELAAMAADLREQYAKHMDTLHFAKALQEVWKLIARGNKYIEETAPWALAKNEASRDRLSTVLYALAETIRIATIHISPFMPSTPARVYEQLGLTDPAFMTWESAEYGAPLGGLLIDRKDPIFPRIDPEAALATEPDPGEGAGSGDEGLAPEGVLPCIGFQDFLRADLRVAEVLDAERVEKTEKLLRLTVSLGDARRTIVAGIAKHYDPVDLRRKKIIVVANLEPAKLRGITSEGMLLAATTPDGGRMSLLTVDKDIPAGTKVG